MPTSRIAFKSGFLKFWTPTITNVLGNNVTSGWFFIKEPDGKRYRWFENSGNTSNVFYNNSSGTINFSVSDDNKLVSLLSSSDSNYESLSLNCSIKTEDEINKSSNAYNMYPPCLDENGNVRQYILNRNYNYNMHIYMCI